ncbi:FAD-dependent oxidoreductase [Chitinophaga polysaccharea]|uniref:FAD-dependent oxidoreductase n=1 Tax=Chitinophaga polysaccharea TaxID=1293035 RepID=UPI0011588F5E|nr:FAD-dependent oxidoreductase [Chitinophaga polysaccharea]
MIARDAYTTSLWQDHATPFAESNKAQPETLYDVIIIGGGITGISTAFLLQDEGKNCLLLEAENIGYGTSGGTTAHLNTLLDVPYYQIQKNFGKEAAQQVYASATEAIALIRHNISRWGIDCGFRDANAILFAQNEEQDKELDKIAKTSAEAGLEMNTIDSLPVDIPFTRAMQAGEQATFSPLQYIQGMARAFETAGGTILQQCRVTGIENNNTVTVTTNAGAFKAKAVIYATHIPTGINLLHLRCTPYRSYAMAFTLENGQYPEELIYDMYDPYHYYRTQEADGQKYLIAGGEDHKTGEQENTQQCFLKLEAHIRQHFKVKEIKYRWSSQYYEPVDGLPYIGRLPGTEDNIYVATGYGGNGMTYSSVAALLLKRLILGQNPKNELLFDPNRLKPVAGFSQFISHNADVVKQFMGKFFSGEQLEALAGVAPGEGKVVEYENQKIAVYKDEQGKLYAVKPICTHMKCEVGWNTAERSWDCPCHGARYDIEGKVLNTPADQGLEQLDIT